MGSDLVEFSHALKILKTNIPGDESGAAFHLNQKTERRGEAEGCLTEEMEDMTNLRARMRMR